MEDLGEKQVKRGRKEVLKVLGMRIDEKGSKDVKWEENKRD